MGKYNLHLYFREQLSKLPIPSATDDVNSKTFLVTGSNIGLGFEACAHLANMGPKALVMTCRDEVKCEQTRESILKRAAAKGASNAQPEIRALSLELGSFQSVRAFVDKFVADGCDALDVLVANAGVTSYEYTLTEDGWETMMQVNYLSTVLLSILLLPYLINASSPDSPSRLVIVSSFGHYFHQLKGVDLWSNILGTINEPGYDQGRRYPISKLFGIIFVRELASRLPESTPVIACAVNPGFCKSNIFRTRTSRIVGLLLRKPLLLRTTEQGSRTLVHAAVASDRSMHGRYLSCCKVVEESDFLYTPEGKTFSARVWDETITLLSGIDDRVSGIVEKYLRVSS